MTRRLLVLAAAALLLAPAAALAGTSTSSANASKQCAVLRAKVGPGPFAQAFDSFGGCVSNLTPLATKNATAATARCRSLRAQSNFAAAHGGKSFLRFYGTGPGGRNAFARCVFATTNARITAQASAAATCVSEQSDAGFSASHAGKTFAQFYGTGPGFSDALGRCIVATVVAPLGPQTAPSTTPSTQTEPGVQSSVIQRECGGSSGGGSSPLHPLPAGTSSCAVG